MKMPTSAPTVASAASVSRQLPTRASRTTATSSISAEPTGNAAARHEFDNSSAGVVMNDSSCAKLIAGPITIARNAIGAAIAITSRKARTPGDAMPTSAVIRICSPRRNAITAPSMASHRNSMDASSSDHTSGACSR